MLRRSPGADLGTPDISPFVENVMLCSSMLYNIENQLIIAHLQDNLQTPAVFMASSIANMKKKLSILPLLSVLG